MKFYMVTLSGPHFKATRDKYLVRYVSIESV